MNINDITRELSKAKNLQSTNEALADEIIYDLGARLGWNDNKTNYFYYLFSNHSNIYEAVDLLSGGIIDFEYNMQSDSNFDPF
ncbi:hypothetical protein [Aliivibrio fischeri]|uniref:Uncharacterized protein n=1 Tax=Aliivibrio fischeri SR5 TaxID=1088719 RepID=A0AAV3EMR0_ALIFS|nr:hypothetical protein [Aliivibrio fischeri]EHN67987.1 hypothetical protein VFSR5_2712 [Aliivibrio fischeri SR5]